MPVVLLVGSDQIGSLEGSYARAFSKLGWDARFWDPLQALRRAARGGRLGQLLSAFIQVEPWIKKANRALVVQVHALKPDLVLTFTHPAVRPGALAQIRSSIDAVLVNVWPDTLVNWETSTSACVGLYDLVATYSNASVPSIERMGGRRVAWIPLAGDPDLHPVHSGPVPPEFCADVTFIGGWRPERESLLSQLGRFDLKIWGPDWGRRSVRNSEIRRAWQGRALRGVEFAQATAGSKVNLNIIDPTNYPAANMRFFEIPIAGGLQVSSACPEMEHEFRHGEHIFYYRDEHDLQELVGSLLSADAARAEVADRAHREAQAKHTYRHRALAILEQCAPKLLPREGQMRQSGL
jgi:hypothetical protein